MFKVDDDLLLMLRQAVEKEFGSLPLSPADFDRLAEAIGTSCKDRIASSTLKRIWGYVRNPHSPTFSTLSVLARYAGYRDWDAFYRFAMVEADSGFSTDELIVASEESIGTRIRIEWAGCKGCEIVKAQEPNLFEVSWSMNIKLREGDMCRVNSIAVGERFVASDCHRAGREMGIYIGARHEGIATIRRQDS